MLPRPTIAIVQVVFLAGAFAAHGAYAAPNGGKVTGVIKFKPAVALGEPPVKSRGFAKRISNPVRATRRFDPTPYMMVVLEGGKADPADSPALKPAQYELIGESFVRPLLGIQLGREVEIKNTGRSSPHLTCLTSPQLVPSGPINPGGVRAITVEKPNTTFELKSPGSAHLVGAVVAFETPYFARVSPKGKFEITGVPAGNWNVKVWYRDGWVKMTSVSVKVNPRRPNDVGTLTIAAPIKIAGAPK